MYLEFYITRNPNHSAEQTTIHYNSWSLNSTPWSSTLLTIYPPPYKSSESWTKSLQLIGSSPFRNSRITRRWRARIRRSLCWRTCTRTRSTTFGLQPSQGWILWFPIWSFLVLSPKRIGQDTDVYCLSEVLSWICINYSIISFNNITNE